MKEINQNELKKFNYLNSLARTGNQSLANRLFIIKYTTSFIKQFQYSSGERCVLLH